MSTFWQQGVTDTNIVGGPARILISDRGVTSYPELISDVLSLTTYQPASNWYDVGHTSTPFVSTNGFDTTNWVSQQSGIINIQVGNWNRRITVTMMESKNDKVMDLVHQTDGRTTNADGDEVEYFWDQPDVTDWRVVAINLQEEGTSGSNIIMDVFPNCKRSGADSETAWSREEPQTHSVELMVLPDPDVPYDASWYRISE